MRFKHQAFCDKDHVEAEKKQLLFEMQHVHLATSGLAAAPLAATLISVLRSVSVPTAKCASSVTHPITPQLHLKEAYGRILTSRLYQHNNNNLEVVIL